MKFLRDNLCRGDSVMIHGDALSLLNFSGDTIVDRFETMLSLILDCIGQEGNILIPSFTYSSANNEVFDPFVSLPRVGGFANLAFRSNKFRRTLDPMFSWLVLGKAEKRLTSTTFMNAFGDNSSFALIEQLKPKVMMLGVPLSNGFTYVHRLEEKHKVNYRFHKKFPSIISVNGVKSEFDYTYFVRELKEEYKCDLSGIESELLDGGILTSIMLRTKVTIIDCTLFEDFVNRNILSRKNMLIRKNER